MAIPTLECPQMSSLIQSKYHMDTRECMKLIKLWHVNDHKDGPAANSIPATSNNCLVFIFQALVFPHVNVSPLKNTAEDLRYGATCEYCTVGRLQPLLTHRYTVRQRLSGKHTHLQGWTPCRIIGQVHRGLKCTTAVFVEQNIMFPHYYTMEYGEPAQLALGGLDWRTGPSN